MPQYQTYTLTAELASGDKILFYDASAGALKTVLISSLSEKVKDEIRAVTKDVDGHIELPLIDEASYVGDVVAKWPVYDELGILRGYVPIYDTII